MDPLSITASVIAVLGLSVKVTQGIGKLRGLREADDLLHALMNEITTLRAIAGQVEAVLRQHRDSLSAEQIACLESLEHVLKAAKAKLEELDHIIHYKLLRPKSDPSNDKLSRRAWLNYESDIQRLQQELRTLRQDIGTLVGTLNLSSSLRIEYIVQGLSLVTRERHAAQNEHHQSSSQALIRLDEQSNGTLAQLQKIQNQLEDTARCLKSAGPTEFDSSPPSNIAGSSPVPTPDTTIGIRLVQRTENTCVRLCNCACHKPSRLGMKFLDRVIGSLFVGYTGLPGITPPCNEHSCRKGRHRANFSAHFTYYFPSWFLTRMISSAIKYTPRDGPQILFIRAPRIRPDNANIFWDAIDGDVVAMQQAFSTGRASPFDVSDDVNRSSLLHFAVTEHRVEVCTLLIREGADPYLRNAQQVSAYDLAWDNILSWEEISPNASKALRSIFDDTDRLDDRQFPPLHRIVLGLDGGSLDHQLSISTSTIDDVDSDRRTAISWAAARGDIDCVQTLLKHGADPNICASTDGRSPLHYAWMVDDKGALIRAILDAGGNLDRKDAWRRTPLHYACRNGNVQNAALLLSRGADINAVTWYGYTPLFYAIDCDNFDIITHLLENGADIDWQDNNGLTALHISVVRNSHRSLQALLRFKPNLLLKSHPGYTILHVAACWGDIQTLEILTEARMKGLPLDARDVKYNETAKEWALAGRAEELSEWWEAFYGLLDSTLEDDNVISNESSTNGDEVRPAVIEDRSTSDEDEPVFEDAVQELS
ncbi:MAG: hypothetical protein M1812_007194 [Candelaria pacifica]|nr:MAG: hypothetical protein M1812_007194 [Candelaria pacifica]